jgi:hypothetical protein
MAPMIPSLLLVVAFVVTRGEVAYCQSRGSNEGKRGGLEVPVDPPLPPQGTPALRVKAGAAAPFTLHDVEQYFANKNLPKNKSSTADFRVDTLEFLTNEEVTKRLDGASPGLGNTDKIGFVTLKGEFIFTGPSPSPPTRFTRAYAAFDARTGNLLMFGTLGQEQRPRESPNR